MADRSVNSSPIAQSDSGRRSAVSGLLTNPVTVKDVYKRQSDENAPGDTSGVKPMLTTIEKVILLKSVEFFTGTPDSVLAQVAELIEEVSVAAGDVIIARGDAGDSMYVVAQGLLRVHVDDVTLAWILETDVVGELALLDGAPRSASVTAVQDGLLLRLGREAYHCCLLYTSLLFGLFGVYMIGAYVVNNLFYVCLLYTSIRNSERSPLHS